MKIKKMTADFGALERAVLTPSDGLTVITAPNEGGKSTWAGFLKAMLYGIDTRERDKAGFLADKNRYQPWSGLPMSGELELEWEGRDITLRRFSNRSGPFQGFEAVYTASGDPVPGLTAANAGQTLLGVGRDVFVRSALVGQNGAVISSAPELERRIAALATSGQEDVSYSATERTLKDWRNRRRANRANGLIPELEEELARTERTLQDMQQARDRREQAREQLDRLHAEQEELAAEAVIHQRLARKELNRRYGQALEALSAARRQLDQLPAADPDFAGLTAQQAREQARAKIEEERIGRARREQEEQRQKILKHRAKVSLAMTITVPVLGFGGLLLVILGFILKLYAMSFVGFGCMAAAVVAAMIFVSRLGKWDRLLARQKAAEPPPADDTAPLAAAEAYADWLARKDQLEREVRHCQERADDLKAQGGREYDTLELLHPPLRSAQETAARQRAVEVELARWQTQLDQAIGALQADPLALEARRDALLADLEERTLQYDALDLALQGLDAANSVLRERFSPALNQEAAAIFSALTGGKYQQLSLSRDFSAQAGGSSPALPHSALYLSAGTVDQLYLAVRLAVCRLTLPGSPILLDDALAAFDDSRMALALDWLEQLSRERQVLLFTCHSREARWARDRGVPVLSLQTV